MSFNDSFGPNNNIGEDENKNNNISFEGNQNNNISFEGNQNNNISFEENKVNNEQNLNFEDNNVNDNDANNLSFENIKVEEKDIIDKNNNEEEKQDDIFNSVPMEIKNQENRDDLLYYENQLITEQIKYNLSIMFNILKKNLYSKKCKFFQKLKDISNYKLTKLVKAEIMFLNIQNKLSIFHHIERHLRYKFLKEAFIKIKLLRKIKKYKESQDKKKETEMKNKIKEMNDNLKKNENNLKEITNAVDKLKQNEKNINNELDEMNKKTNKLNIKYTNLNAKSKELKEALMQRMTNFSSTLDKTIDPRIVELQNMIKNKERDKEKSMNYFEDFYKKMSDILDMYEANYENIKATINSTGTTNA